MKLTSEHSSMKNTIEYKEVLAMGISHNEYKRAVNRGEIIVIRRGSMGTPTLIDSNSRYLLQYQNKQK